MPQAVTFLVDDVQITVSDIDAVRLAGGLRTRPDEQAHTAADRIERATDVGGSNIVELDLIEDDEALAVLVAFEESGGVSGPLARLAQALQAKIDRDLRQ